MSARGIGKLISVGLANEATRGNANTTAGYWNPFLDLTIDETKEFATDSQACGIIEDNVNLTQTKKWVAGTLTGNVYDASFPPLLYAMFGSYAKTGAGPYVHTFADPHPAYAHRRRTRARRPASPSPKIDAASRRS